MHSFVLSFQSGYSPSNFPHLTPALELDDAIIEFSGTLESKGLPTEMRSSADIDAVVNGLRDYLKRLDFWQYYVLDVQQEKDAIGKALAAGVATAWAGPDIRGKSPSEIAQIVRAYDDEGLIQGLGKYARRFGVHIDGAVALGILQAASGDVSADSWGKVVDILNVPLYEEWENDTKIALDNIRNRLSYTRLDEHGPKMGRISKK